MLTYGDGVADININDLETKRTPFLEIETIKIQQEKLLVYDLAGQDNPAHPLRILQDQVLGHTQLIIFAFALDRFSSLAHLGSWYLKIKDYYLSKQKPLPEMILVGTKSDQPRKLDFTLISKVLTSTEIETYIPTSSVTGDGIKELKRRILKILVEHESKNVHLKSQKSKV